ncbi:MAG TPA: flagellar biosynthetic protein FliO [Planctomycetaceae bacterium]|nr:flagellar biosynthetic protein FliO [Planctomycetaceae bacterium]
MFKRFSLMLLAVVTVFSAEVVLVASADDQNAASETQLVSRPISPPTELAENSENHSDARTGSFVTTLGALGLILLIFLGLVQMWKKRSPQSFQKLPEEAWQELGSTRLDHRYQVRLIRVGSRILVLGQSDTNLQTLSEITAPEEVANLVAHCGRRPGQEQRSRFHSLYEQFLSRTDSPAAAGSTIPSLASREANGG